MQKNPRVRKMFVRDSGAGNGCANFMGAWQNCLLSARENLHVHKIPRFKGGGGGGILCFSEGGGVPILFLWARGFF